MTIDQIRADYERSGRNVAACMTVDKVDWLIAEVVRLRGMIDDLKGENAKLSMALTKVNNVVAPLWSELRELRGGCQTWEKYWEQQQAAEAKQVQGSE